MGHGQIRLNRKWYNNHSTPVIGRTRHAENNKYWLSLLCADVVPLRLAYTMPADGRCLHNAHISINTYIYVVANVIRILIFICSTENQSSLDNCQDGKQWWNLCGWGFWLNKHVTADNWIFVFIKPMIVINAILLVNELSFHRSVTVWHICCGHRIPDVSAEKNCAIVWWNKCALRVQLKQLHWIRDSFAMFPRMTWN